MQMAKFAIPRIAGFANSKSFSLLNPLRPQAHVSRLGPIPAMLKDKSKMVQGLVMVRVQVYGFIKTILCPLFIIQGLANYAQ